LRIAVSSAAENGTSGWPSGVDMSRSNSSKPGFEKIKAIPSESAPVF
jgi:hypothetical protein